MANIAEQFDVEVNDETYTITRVLDERNEKFERYGFATSVNGQEVKLGATLTTEVIGDLEAQRGINVIKELTDILLAEFQLEISKIKEEQ